MLQEKKTRQSRRRIDLYYPETGPLRREAYPRHMEFFAAGATHLERCMLAANRIGKTEGVGAYELSLHLTGQYPHWWVGRRFDRPVKAWAAGTTGKTVREILQDKLLGPPSAVGTGMIPGDAIIKTRPKGGGVPDAVDTVMVQHVSGGFSILVLKSYQEGRVSFEGTEQDVILMDEEPSVAIYMECLIRTMTTDGLLLCTFTPLRGRSDTVRLFIPDDRTEDGPDSEVEDQVKRFIVSATWDDAPHLSAAAKARLWASLPPHQREARSKGVPQLGAGAIYPVAEEDITVDDFAIPDHWPRAYGMDVGWNRTAAVWGAWDRENDIVYLYTGHYRGQAEPVIHAEAVRGRGEWIPGTMDPAARGRGQKDGEQLIQSYIDLGLDLCPAINAVETGLYAVWQRLSNGKLKVFRSMSNWFSEYRGYHRNEKGAIVKDKDHYMDATRYLIMSGLDIACVVPVQKKNIPKNRPGNRGGWMGA